MVDKEPGRYRPRRAFIEPPTDPVPPVDPSPAAPSAATPAPVPSPAEPDEDQLKPLYRDEVPTAGPTSADSETEPTSPSGDPIEASGANPPRPITFNRPPRDEPTTVLPRATGRRAAPVEVDDADATDDEHRPLHPKVKWGLLIAAVAAVVVAGLFVVYSVSGYGQPAPITQPTVAGTSNPDPSGTSSTEPGPTTSVEPPQPTLDQASMLSAKSAQGLVNRTWKVAKTETQDFSAATQPACFANEPPQGQPATQARIQRVLTSSGKKAPGALHDATAYASAEEAQQAYDAALLALGSCTVPGSYIVEGRSVVGLGDEAAGEVVAVTTGSATTMHTVVVTRTGRVVDLLDAYQPTTPIKPKNVVLALGASVDAQCTTSGGKCSAKPDDSFGPPPPGGDEPGFLAAGDLPPAGTGGLAWEATRSEAPSKTFAGSQCETVNWTTLASTSTLSRVYLQRGSGTTFGLNEIVVTLKDAKSADALVEKIKSNLTTCKERVLTASVSTPAKVTSVGAKRTTVSGYTATVAQQSSKATTNYRVGIVAAGKKVAYTFLNPQAKQDFTSAQWDTVALRAGERATQAK